MSARIYQPTRNAMQSGQGKTKKWVLEFSQSEVRNIDPLMGWTGSGDMESQVKLSFETKDEAIAYASQKGITYTLQEPKERKACESEMVVMVITLLQIEKKLGHIELALFDLSI
jgi:NADH dehydrogenase